MKPLFPKIKALINIVLICFGIVNCYSQSTNERNIVEADSAWGREIILFPIEEWAPKLTLEGYEELRFAPNWENVAHEEFWTLVMSWNVKSANTIPLYELSFNLQHYFDGLMKPNHWATDFMNPIATFDAPIVSESTITYKGVLQVFDGFHTGKRITLYILGEQNICKETGRSIIIFKFSTKKYSQPIWDKLKNIKMNPTICDE